VICTAEAVALVNIPADCTAAVLQSLFHLQNILTLLLYCSLFFCILNAAKVVFTGEGRETCHMVTEFRVMAINGPFLCSTDTRSRPAHLLAYKYHPECSKHCIAIMLHKYTEN